MIRIITDSTSDLNLELARERCIEITPLTVNIGGRTYQDGLELRSENLFLLVKLEITPDGSMDVKDKARGSRRKGLQMLLDNLEAHLPNGNPQRVCISHTGCYDDAEFMLK